jgi:hypothetical protein
MVCLFVRKPHGIPTWLSLVLSIQVLLCALVVTRQAAALPLLPQDDTATTQVVSAPATMLTLMSIVSRGPTVPASLVTNAPRNSEGIEGTEADDEGDDGAAPQPQIPPSAAWFAGFCDPRGASGIAPLPALPVQGGAVDADPDGPCGGSRLQSASNVHGGDDLPSRLAADGDALLLGLPTPMFTLPRRFAEHTLPRETERRWALPRGYRRAVDHPPRG